MTGLEKLGSRTLDLSRVVTHSELHERRVGGPVDPDESAAEVRRQSGMDVGRGEKITVRAQQLVPGGHPQFTNQKAVIGCYSGD